jgi:hypothetical protein
MQIFPTQDKVLGARSYSLANPLDTVALFTDEDSRASDDCCFMQASKGIAIHCCLDSMLQIRQVGFLLEQRLADRTDSSERDDTKELVDSAKSVVEASCGQSAT